MTDREKYTPTKVFLEQLAEITHQAENVCQSCGNTRALSAPKVKPDARCMIVFEDNAAEPIHIDDFETALKTYELKETAWTCRLFVDFSALEPTANTRAEIRAEAFREAAKIVLSDSHTPKEEKTWVDDRPYVCEETAYRAILALIDKEDTK